MEYSDGQTETWGKRGDPFPNPIVQLGAPFQPFEILQLVHL